jgi:hypothetical protein
MFGKLLTGVRGQKRPVDTTLTPNERGLLEILISEVQETLPQGEGKVTELLQRWVNANDLHPENVRSLTPEEFNREFGNHGLYVEPGSFNSSR